MGLNTWVAFYGNDSNAKITGDVATLSGEVTPVSERVAVEWV